MPADDNSHNSNHNSNNSSASPPYSATIIRTNYPQRHCHLPTHNATPDMETGEPSSAKPPTQDRLPHRPQPEAATTPQPALNDNAVPLSYPPEPTLLHNHNASPTPTLPAPSATWTSTAASGESETRTTAVNPGTQDASPQTGQTYQSFPTQMHPTQYNNYSDTTNHLRQHPQHPHRLNNNTTKTTHTTPTYLRTNSSICNYRLSQHSTASLGTTY